jgi:hypothetical protein
MLACLNPPLLDGVTAQAYIKAGKMQDASKKLEISHARKKKLTRYCAC